MKNNVEKDSATPEDDGNAGDLPKGDDLRALQGEELTWEQTPEEEDLEVSDTDDDEDEGVGDGTIGNTRPDLLDK